MANCKACGEWFGTATQKDLCTACERALNRLNKYVEPVIYGQWMPINEDELDPRCKCSNCGNVDTPLSGYKFCPYCGAKMNGGINNGKT